MARGGGRKNKWRRKKALVEPTPKKKNGRGGKRGGVRMTKKGGEKEGSGAGLVSTRSCKISGVSPEGNDRGGRGRKEGGKQGSGWRVKGAKRCWGRFS